MLVLSRRERDAIMIGHDIVVTVLSIGRDHVRIGIAAPKSVEVHREEVYQAIQEANRQAASAGAGGVELLSGLVGGRPEEPPAGDGQASSAAAPAAGSTPAQAVSGSATP